jgi:hypothetical protein
MIIAIGFAIILACLVEIACLGLIHPDMADDGGTTPPPEPE